MKIGLFLAFGKFYCYNLSMERDKYRFVAVEFADDENVRGYYYWYLCEFAEVYEGCEVLAPLGRHNRLQTGIVRAVRYGDEFNAPYPVHSIKYVRQVLSKKEK